MPILMNGFIHAWLSIKSADAGSVRDDVAVESIMTTSFDTFTYSNDMFNPLLSSLELLILCATEISSLLIALLLLMIACNPFSNW